MSTSLRFGRVLTAIITPFDEKQDVNFKAYSNLCDWQLANGCDTLLVCGTTGESPTLSVGDKMALFGIALNKTAGLEGKYTVANVGCNNTAESVELARQAAGLGVDGIMAVVPYYNKPSQEGLFLHFKAIADAVPETPVIMYNIPSRSVVNLEPETTLRLIEACSNIAGMKEASTDFSKTKIVLDGAREDFEVWSGNDDKTLELMGMGASGVISTTSNVLPQGMADMVNAYGEGDTAKAQSIHDIITPLMSGLFAAPNPTLVKAVLNGCGREVGGLRLPMVEATTQQAENIMGIYNKVIQGLGM